MNFAKNYKIIQCAVASSAGTDAVTGDIVDTTGWEGLIFLTAMHVNNSGNYIKAQQDTDSAGGTMADLEGTKVICGKADQVLGIDIYRPKERYVRCIGTRGSSTAMDTIYCILYSGRKAPYDNEDSTGEVYVESFVSPSEGTA